MAGSAVDIIISGTAGDIAAATVERNEEGALYSPSTGIILNNNPLN